jgi:DNA-binding LacI/PurR family transcriptional regulator
LTTLRVDKARMGRLAVETLLDRLTYPAAARVAVMVMPELVERVSVAPPKNA